MLIFLKRKQYFKMVEYHLQYRNFHFEFVTDVLILFRTIFYKTLMLGQLLYFKLLIVHVANNDNYVSLLPVRLETESTDGSIARDR